MKEMRKIRKIKKIINVKKRKINIREMREI